ncbi:hypothetical protein D9613_007680 [Agrocybe pediades]|uniref:CCHC-type domain-containing protein n=1 Tax=Agrocybe pediades TaxID=84607 RepID=A0A8H4QMM8_9AGAR|nr:hypothetical protein D9613_007680 [Agrocybe pediades]
MTSGMMSNDRWNVEMSGMCGDWKAKSNTKTLSPDVLILLLNEEYERQKLQRARRSGKSKDDSDEAMAVTPGGSNQKGGKGGGKKSHIECWNCGEKGHYKDKCPKPVKAKSGDKKKEEKRDSLSKKDGSANAAAESDVDSESEGVFAAMETDSESVRSQELIPGSHSMSASVTRRG